MAILLWAATAALLCLAAWCARLYIRAHRMHRLTASIPGLPRLPFIGNAHQLMVPHDTLIGALRGWNAAFGDLYKFWIGPFLMIIVLDPEDLQALMASPSASSKPRLIYQSVEGVLGKGLLILHGKDYRRHRKTITFSLNSDNLQEFSGTFSAQCRELEKRLDPLAETGEVLDPKHHLGILATNTVFLTILGAPGLKVAPETTVTMLDEASQVTLFRCLRPWFGSKALFKLMSSWHDRYYGVVDWFNDVADKVLALKMQMLQQSQQRSTLGAHCHKTFVDTALSSESSALSRDELREEIKTMAATGIGTSMDFLTTFLLCMSLTPKSQRRVQQELSDVFGSDTDRDIEASDLPHLKYLEYALKETLRLFSPAPVMARQISKDVQLPSGQVLPEGCIVSFLPIVTHRNPRFYPDPDRFDPDRFSPERSQNLHPFAFIPFSGGLRSCPGQRYGMLFAKTVAASLLRRYDVLPDPHGPQRLEDVVAVAGISLTIKGGVHVRLRRRQLP